MKTEYELPYEKFLHFGAEYLSESELLAIILRTGTKGIPCLEVAKEVLALSSGAGLLGLHHISLRDLMHIKGIGEVKAVKVKCIAELSNRIAKQNAVSALCFDSPSTVADYYMEQLRHQETERVILSMVNGKNRLIEDIVLSTGSVNASILSPRETFRQALKCDAVYVFLVHNHPSGDPTPSRQDIAITQQIKEASGLVEIPLLDHIIIGDNRYISFKEKGLL